MRINRILKFICLAVAVLSLVSCSDKVGISFYHLEGILPDSAGTSIINPGSEVRGVWIASVFNINYPSRADLSASELKKEIDNILDTCERNKLNTVFFQVRPSADALYDSDIFPVSSVLSSKRELTFDPLEYIVSEGHKRNIFIHAWVNPLRVTAAADSEGSLPSDSPAVLHPEWTVKYADGKLYFNAGLPEVRELIADGVCEIVKKYDVDGVVFDDYFYPYPVNDADFDDADAYQEHGEGFESVADWRRNNINLLVEKSYNAVKEADPECIFGVSPAGVWQNNDGLNGGSDTAGFEAYKFIYCDAVAWIKGGYIDYIAPQIYWQIGKSGTPFDTVADWWNGCVDGTDVKLWIAHGVYRYDEAEWSSPSGEMKSQVEYARKLLSYRGSVFYGYDKIRDNAFNVTDELSDVYENEVVYCDPSSSGKKVSFVYPYIGADCPTGKVTVVGKSDPSKDLTCNGANVGRSKDGSFEYEVTIVKGENRIVFAQDGKEYILTVYGAG